MAYQNNNNRAVPRETQNTILQPQASPVDRTIKYQVDLTGVSSAKATADALVKLGQGMMDYDIVLRKQAQEASITTYEETKIDNNKKEWVDVSKKVTGMARFNPYIKDAYLTLVSKDIYRAAALKLNSDPLVVSGKATEEQFNSLVNTTRAEMITAFNESGIKPRHYGGFLEQYSKDAFSIAEAYTQKNSAYNYNNNMIAQASDLALNTGINTLNAITEADKSTAISTTLNNKINELTELGIPKDDIAKILTTGIQSYIIDNADTISSAALAGAIKDLKIDGTDINSIIPNHSYNVQKFIKEAKKAVYDDRLQDWNSTKLQLEMSQYDASIEIYNWDKSKKGKATVDETFNFLQQTIAKHGLEGVGFSVFGDMVSDKKKLTELMEVRSDNNVLQELGVKAAYGNLTGEDLAAAYSSKQLNWRDGLYFSDRINREAKQVVKDTETDYKEVKTKFSKTGLYKNLPNKTEYLTKLNNQILMLEDKDVTPEKVRQVNKAIADLDRAAAAQLKIETNKNSNDSLLLNPTYIRTQQAPTFNKKDDVEAFKKLGYLRGNHGQRVNPDITSAPNQNRTITINGKTTTNPHIGYDLAATNQTQIRNWYMDGTVVSAGKTSGFGNYVVIKYTNGNYVRIGHMSTTTHHLHNTKIKAGEYIGNAGMTGKATGVHGHFDFWNSQKNVISASEFSKGLK